MNERSKENQESKKNKPKKTIKEWLTLNWGKYISSIGSLFAAVGALAALSAVLFMFFVKPLPYPKLARTIDLRSGIRDSSFRETKWYFIERLAEQEDIINNINNRLKVLIKSDTTTAVGVQIALIHSDVKTLDSRIQILEEGLLENPEKALAIPLLRKDIQNIKRSYNENITAMNKNIDRIYDQNKWFIGLMVSIAIGFIGLVVSNFLQMRKIQ